MKKILGHDVCIQTKRAEKVGKRHNSDYVLFHFLTPKD